jgi:iron complex outermembrane receptor protein
MKTNKTTLAVLIAGCFGATAAAAEETKVLSPVVVTATRVEQDSFDLPMSIDKVEKKDIQDAQLRMTLSESLSRIPGITAQNRNQMAQDPQISSRGFGARSSFGVRGIRLYVDGIPLSMPDGIGNPGSIDLGVIGGIEVMRGPFSAMYGNSSGGVIQLLTDAAPARPEVSADVLYGSFGTRRESVQAAGTRQGVEYLVNFSDYTSDGFRQHSANEKRQATAKLGVRLSEDTKLTTLVNWFDQTALDPGGLIRTGTSATAPGAITRNAFYNPAGVASIAVTNRNRVIRSNTQVGFNLEHKIDSSNTLNMVAYAGQRENLQYLPNSASSIARDFYGAEMRLNNRGDFLGRTYNISAGLNAGFMEDARLNQTASGGTITNAAPSRDETQKALNFDQFVQSSWSFADRWDLHAGIRHTNLRQSVLDRITSNGDGTGSVRYERTIPVAGLIFKATPTLNVYANVGKGFETPTMIEISYNNDTTGTGPNLGLKPSTSTNIEVGTKWLVNDDTRFNAALFDISTENEIVVQSTNTYTVYNNSGKTKRQGAELNFEARLPMDFSVYLAYTLLDAKFDENSAFNANKVIPGTYRTQLFGEIAWRHQPMNFVTALEVRHGSKTFTKDDNTEFAPSYTVLSARASLQQHWNQWRLTEYVRIDNLTDEAYIGSVRVNDSNNRFFEPAPGRNYIVGIKANYAF